MNISGIFKLFAHWSDCVDRNDKVFTLLYKIVMHKKVSHPDEIQNTNHIYLHSKLRTNQRPIDTCTAEPILIVYIYDALLISFLWQFLTLLPRIICNKV